MATNALPNEDDTHSPDPAQIRLVNNQTEAHLFCFVCSGSNPMGPALRYASHPDGSVSASFLGNCTLEGYSGLLHGGVIAAMLDGAMTSCLFARGIRGLTAEVKVRYHESVAASEEVFYKHGWRTTRLNFFNCARN